MKPSLFQHQELIPDTRPAMLSMAALMMLLLPTLLLCLAPQKLTGLPLSVSGPSEALPPPPPGAVEKLLLQATPDGFTIQARVRRTDVLASAGDVETKNWTLTEADSLPSILRQIKSLDTTRKRITVIPTLETSTAQLVWWMDLCRKDSQGELFPEVILQSDP